MNVCLSHMVTLTIPLSYPISLFTRAEPALAPYTGSKGGTDAQLEDKAFQVARLLAGGWGVACGKGGS